MTEDSTGLESLAASWVATEQELRDGGYDHEADVVAVCREALADQLERQGASRVRVLLRVWADDAAVLKTYGYQSAAESLWRCREALEAALEAGYPKRATPGVSEPSSGPHHGYRPVPPPGSAATRWSSDGSGPLRRASDPPPTRRDWST